MFLNERNSLVDEVNIQEGAQLFDAMVLFDMNLSEGGMLSENVILQEGFVDFLKKQAYIESNKQYKLNDLLRDVKAVEEELDGEQLNTKKSSQLLRKVFERWWNLADLVSVPAYILSPIIGWIGLIVSRIIGKWLAKNRTKNDIKDLKEISSSIQKTIDKTKSNKNMDEKRKKATIAKLKTLKEKIDTEVAKPIKD